MNNMYQKNININKKEYLKMSMASQATAIEMNAIRCLQVL